jgi:hypothetical protein
VLAAESDLRAAGRPAVNATASAQTFLLGVDPLKVGATITCHSGSVTLLKHQLEQRNGSQWHDNTVTAEASACVWQLSPTPTNPNNSACQVYSPQTPVVASDNEAIQVVSASMVISKDVAGDGYAELDNHGYLYDVGRPATFVFTVTNTGFAPLANITISDDVTTGDCKGIGTLSAPDICVAELIMVGESSDDCLPGYSWDDDALHCHYEPKDRDGVVTECVTGSITMLSPLGNPEFNQQFDLAFPLREFDLGSSQLNGGEMITCRRTILIDDDDVEPYQESRIHRNTVTINADAILGEDDEQQPIIEQLNRTDNETLRVRTPSISLHKSLFTPGPYTTFQEAWFTFEIQNTGNLPLTSVSLVDEVTSGDKSVMNVALCYPGRADKVLGAAIPPSPLARNQANTAFAVTLFPGDYWTCRAKVPLSLNFLTDGTHSNEATVTGFTAGGELVTAISDYTIYVEHPEINLHKQALGLANPSADAICAGPAGTLCPLASYLENDPVVFAYVLVNSSSFDVEQVEIVDKVDPGLASSATGIPAVS